MNFEWDPEHVAFRREVRAFIHEWRTPALLEEYSRTYGAQGPEIKKFHEALAGRGWMRMCWPREQGGEGKNFLYQFILIEAMEYWGMPYGNLTVTSIAPALAAHGSEAQQQHYLPRIWSGAYTFALGYSEPNAGTDLAALRTKAERVGDEWVINGSKIWTSLADVATHIWLAVRSDPDARKHKGISIIIVPTSTPGVSVRPLPTMYGGHTNETFYEDVRVPVGNTVGEVNGGWPIMMHALNHERVALAALGGLARIYDLLVDHLREHRPELLADPVVRHRLAKLRLRLEEHRALAVKNAWIIARGETPISEASMAKISATELRTHLANVAMDLLGRSGGLSKASGERAPAAGHLEFSFRLSPIFRFGGGTNEIQRDIIAMFGLGLPR
jgi:alkylation response protein AidB-like acyl-CoA dehydrogenase